MDRFGLGGPRFRRLFTRQTVFITLAICIVYYLIFELPDGPGHLAPHQWTKLQKDTADAQNLPKRMPTHNVLPPLSDRVACHGPRGHLLGQSPDDEVVERELDLLYPTPWAGSFEEMGLDITWTSADGRYGAYGMGEDRDDYDRKKVDWNKVDWGQLQNDCFENNRHRFPITATRFDDTTENHRFSLRHEAKIPHVRHWHDFEPSRRTAIVVRTWRGFDYRPEDLYFLRSLVAEAGLRSGGEHQVILLVDMKDYEGYNTNIWESEAAYQKGLEDAGVPPEFRSMALLWDVRLLQSWYPLIEEHRTMWQVFQPMQLLALHYPEFDHFWQLEMDMRFLGDAGKYLDRITMSARNEPRKQSLERSSFWHMIAETGDYRTFFQAVDKANNGGTHAWGPMRVSEILPIGPEPPFADPRNDSFQWGVGEEADAITMSYCMDANKPNKWLFRDWIYGLKTGVKTPRFYCPPAIQRASRPLLLVIHQAQLEQGIRVPSEATIPSFALWHGLKLAFPQQPVFHRDREDHENRRKWWRGGPKASTSGLGPDDSDHPRGPGLTFWWESDWAKHVFYEWMGRKLEAGSPRPWLLEDREGKLWAPNIMLHPVKHPE